MQREPEIDKKVPDEVVRTVSIAMDKESLDRWWNSPHPSIGDVTPGELWETDRQKVWDLLNGMLMLYSDRW